MIKVVIADDEERVCRLVQALADFEAMGMELIGTASNGLEALALLSSQMPEILITDIRMPGCNGLELIEKAREICPDILIIIISGYAQFEYAKVALQYGVSEYLLKPISKKELNDSLEKLCVQIRERQIERENAENVKKNRAKDIKRIQGELILQLLDKHGAEETEEQLINQYHLKVKPGCYQAFCLKVNYGRTKPDDHMLELVWERADKVFQTAMSGHCTDWVLYHKDCYLYGILNYPAKEKEAIRRMLRGCLNQMEAQKGLLGSMEFSLGLGSVQKEAECLKLSMEHAILAVQEHYVEGIGRMYEESKWTPILYEKKLLDKFSRKIDHALEVYSTAEAQSAVDELQKALTVTSKVHGCEVLELVQSAGQMFVMRLDIREKEKFLRRFVDECESCKSQQELFEALRSLVTGQMSSRIEAHETDAARPVRLAKSYIQNHYSEQITLEEVSREVGLSPAYFSVLFKKETELGFAKYLMNTRMEQTKVLLRETNLPVAEICRKVGYNDLKHFTHTFEKTVGVKPALYRKLYG